MFGIERMHDDPEPQLPYTNQFIAVLAAMPSVQIVFVGDERNNYAFNAWTGGKVLVSPRLRGEGNCMNISYTIFAFGVQQAVFGQVIRDVGGHGPTPPVDRTPDSSTERWWFRVCRFRLTGALNPLHSFGIPVIGERATSSTGQSPPTPYGPSCHRRAAPE
jgi:hypothetical protein